MKLLTHYSCSFVARSLVAALCIGSASSAWAWGTDYSADDCTKTYSLLKCSMEFIKRGVGVKDLSPDAIKVPPEEVVAPNIDSSKALDIGVAGAWSLIDRGFGAMMLFNAFATTSTPGEYLQVFVIMPMNVAEGRPPQDVAIEALLNGFKQILQFSDAERSGEKSFTVKGGSICGDDGCLIESPLFTTNKGYQKMAGRLQERTPAWLDVDGPVYTWNVANPQLQKLGSASSGKSMINQKMAILLSKVLPDYFYFYLPSANSKNPAVMLNRGKVHYAVTPAN